MLIVDDNATNRRILLDLLGNWKMRPTAVESGPAALSALEQASAAGQPFQLVLLDAHMPDMDGFAVARVIRGNPEWDRIAQVMLTSAGQPGDVARCRELGIEVYLMKPLKQSELLEAVRTALEAPNRRRQWRPEPLQLAPPRSPASAAGPSRLHALLVEDNLVNQKLAIHLLEKQDFSVVLATNGKEALAALEREPFDLILMDVQMPEMNGFEATALIRQAEQGTDRHVPVLAMTAYAMKGDRERCLAAGMDEYISKPIQPDQLFDAIRSLVRSGQSVAPEAKTQAEAPGNGQATSRDPSGGELNWAAALERAGGDEGVLREVVRIFLDTSPGQLVEIRLALERRDAPALQRAAHTLKGSVGIFRGPVGL